jgi:hypothetical protein
MGLDQAAVEARLDAAFDRFLAVYARYGGHRYYGWNKQADPRNYRGPTFWTEGDCVYRLAACYGKSPGNGAFSLFL